MKSTWSRARTPGNRLETARPSKIGVGAVFSAPTVPVDASLSVALTASADARRGSIDGENRFPVRWSQRRGIIKRVDVGLVDHVDLRSNVLKVWLSFENAHGLINRDPALDDSRIGGRCHHATRLDVFVHSRCEVVRDYFDLIGQIAFAEELHGGFGRWGGAGDVFDIRVRLEHILDQFELHFLPGVTVFCRNVLERTILDCVIKAFVAGLNPAGPRRPREPRYLGLG